MGESQYLMFAYTPPIIKKGIMICKQCNKAITDKNIKLINGGLYKCGVCKTCYNAKTSVYNEKRRKAMLESKWF